MNTPQSLPSRKKMRKWWANRGFGVRYFDSLWSVVFGAQSLEHSDHSIKPSSLCYINIINSDYSFILIM